MNRRGLWLLLGLVAATVLALAFRLPRLALRPMHGDEANQAVQAGRLFDGEGYRYSPEEHHGPTLYWLTLPSLWLSGAADFAKTGETAYRIVPVLFGAGLVLLLWLTRDGLGTGATLAAAALTAISPAMVYYSRYYIQETLLVFFTFAAIAAGWRFARRPGWAWAVAFWVSLGLVYATKETGALAVVAMIVAVALTAAWSRWRDKTWPGLPCSKKVSHNDFEVFGRPPSPPAPLPLAGEGRRCWTAAKQAAWLLLATAPVGLLTAAALFSSFGAHWGGLLDSVLAYEVYLRRGSEGGIHAHPWHFYLELLAWFRPARGFFWSEGLILGLAAVGALVALGRRKREFAVSPCDSQGSAAFAERKATVAPASLPGDSALSPLVFGRFLTFYTLTLTLLYCLIPYKTPWCMLSFLHGMILLAGLGAAALVGGAWRAPRMFVSGAAAVGEGRSARWWPAAVGALLAAMVAGALIAAAGQLAWQAYALNFRFPADQRNPYVYAHTSTDALKLAVQIERLAAVSPAGRGLTIHVVVPNNYWPLPWYLRRFDQERIGCWDDVEKWRRAAAAGPPPSVVIFSTEIQAEVDAALLAAYNRQMIYGLRPDVLLAVYVREDLWRAFVAAQSGK